MCFMAIIMLFSCLCSIMAIPIGYMDVDLNDYVYKESNLLNKIKKYSIKEIEPPEHLDAVPIELSGKINSDLHKELFLGEHEDIENLQDVKVFDKFKNIFNTDILSVFLLSADVDDNEFLDENELTEWFLKQVNEHFNDAIKKNNEMFKHMDSDNDGIILWDEYLDLFKSLHSVVRNEETSAIDHNHMTKLDFDNEILQLKERWSLFDSNNDSGLNPTEYLYFRHPETSFDLLEDVSNTIKNKMDKNNDSYISYNEFVFLNVDNKENENFLNKSEEFIGERSKKFTIIDKNEDNMIDISELKEYVNPHNTWMIKNQVRQILDIVDADKNNLIDFDEMIQKIDFFLNHNLMIIDKENIKQDL